MDEKILGPGTRVRVKITSPESYATGAAQALDGKVGTVIRKSLSGEWLVEFDEPAKPWHSHALPVERFHFERHDLEPETAP